MLGRDNGTLHAYYTVSIAPKSDKGANAIVAPRTDTWSSVHASVLAAAKQGQRVSFEAQ